MRCAAAGLLVVLLLQGPAWAAPREHVVSGATIAERLRAAQAEPPRPQALDREELQDLARRARDLQKDPRAGMSSTGKTLFIIAVAMSITFAFVCADGCPTD
jgi:hypothetical protein